MGKFFTTAKLSENIHETPEGFLVCVGVPIARTGEMIYGDGETPLQVGADGKIAIDRSEKDVFNPETIASFEGKPITIGHPIEFVSPDNWKVLAKGSLQNVRRGEGEFKDDLIADLLITDSVAINLVKSGLREVSCGYEAEYTQTGEGRGTQTNLIGNHLALVDEGRAGPSYAINDHKGKGARMKLSEKIKAIFAKAQDEAMQLASDADPKEGEKKDEKAADAAAYDELVKMVKDLGEKISAMGGKQKDDAGAKAEGEKEEKSADADPMAALEERLKALEVSVSKLLESKAGDAEEEESEDSEEDESEDDNFEESNMVGDTASRVEILSPGLKVTKDAKAKALKAAYETADGKKVINSLTGGKAPNLKDAQSVDTLFIAASELLKVSRTQELSRTRQARDAAAAEAGEGKAGPMSAEEMNKINAKHYGKN